MIVVCACIQCIKKMCYFLHDTSDLSTFLKAWHLKHISLHACWNESAPPSRAVVFKLLRHIWDVSLIAHTQLRSWSTVPISWWVNSAVLNKEDTKNVPWAWDERTLGLVAPSVGWSSLMNILFLSLQPSDFSVSLKAVGKNKHFKVQLSNGVYCIGQRRFNSMDELLEHYKKAPIFTSEHGEKLYLIKPLQWPSTHKWALQPDRIWPHTEPSDLQLLLSAHFSPANRGLNHRI